jgi:hypothetical protein
MKVNSFSLFGDKQRWAAYLGTNIRQHFTLYHDPSWVLWVYTDHELNDQGYCPVLRKLAAEGLIRVTVVPDAGQFYQRHLRCTMMLWRMLPIWENTEFVFCRDLDSILTPRQLQCVRAFISTGKAVHGINDNRSHCIPLMGGMCGFNTKAFLDIFRVSSLDDLLRGKFREEGSTIYGYDQDFLTNIIWPPTQQSSCIHRLEGPNDRSANKNVTEANMQDIPEHVRNRGDDFTNYIGAVGCNTSRGSFSAKEIVDFYNEYGNKEKCDQVTQIEKSLGWEWK